MGPTSLYLIILAVGVVSAATRAVLGALVADEDVARITHAGL